MSKKEITAYETPEEFYRAILPAAGMTVGEKGDVQIPSLEGTSPLVIGKKEVYIPTKVLLAKNKWDKVQPFHPLCEDVLCGQSLIYRSLLKLLPAFLNTKLLETIETIVKVATNATLQKEINNPKASVILMDCALNVKPPLAKRWDSLIKKIRTEPLVNVYVGRDLEDSEGTKYSRLALMEFPLLELGDTKDTKIAGVDMLSKGNKESMMEIFKYILKDISPEIGSSAITPYFHVYLKLLRMFTKRLNEINLPFKKVSGWEKLDEDWFTAVDNLDKFVGRIPKLPGNAGEVVKEAVTKHASSIAANQFSAIKIPEAVKEKEDLADIVDTVTVSRERPSRAPALPPKSSISDYLPRAEPRYSHRQDRYDDRYDDRDRYANDRQQDRYEYDRRYANDRFREPQRDNRRMPLHDIDRNRSRSQRGDRPAPRNTTTSIFDLLV